MAETCKDCRYYVGEVECGGSCFAEPPRLNEASEYTDSWQHPPVTIDDPACRFFQRQSEAETKGTR